MTSSEIKNTTLLTYREIVEDIYRNPQTVRRSAQAIHQKAREQGHKILLADVKTILEELPEVQIYKKTKATTKKQQVYPIVTSNPLELWNVDIMYMEATPDKNFKYILNIIDCFSKYVWSFPLVNKTSETVAKRIKSVFELNINGRKNIPKIFASDNGTEFLGETTELLEENKVIQRFGKAYNSNAQSIIERFNLTLRTALRDRKGWAALLPTIIEGYNNGVHNTTKEKPINVHFDKPNGEHIKNARKNIKERADRLIAATKLNITFKPGDFVRIIIFNKNALAKKSEIKKWSDEIYEVEATIKKPSGEFIKLKGNRELYTKNQLLKIKLPKLTTVG